MRSFSNVATYPMELNKQTTASNRRPKSKSTSHGLEDQHITRFLGRTPSSVIPYAAQLDQSANEGRPFVMTRKDNPAARAIFQLASTIAEVRTPKQYERQLWTG